MRCRRHEMIVGTSTDTKQITANAPASAICRLANSTKRMSASVGRTIMPTAKAQARAAYPSKNGAAVSFIWLSLPDSHVNPRYAARAILMTPQTRAAAPVALNRLLGCLIGTVEAHCRACHSLTTNCKMSYTLISPWRSTLPPIPESDRQAYLPDMFLG